MSLQRILAQAIAPSSERHEPLPNIQSVLATQCLSFWHLCVGLVIHGHSNEADRQTAQKIPELDVHNKAATIPPPGESGQQQTLSSATQVR